MRLPNDDDYRPVQALKPKTPVVRVVAAAAEAAHTSAFELRDDGVVRLHATCECRIAIGPDAIADDNAMTMRADDVEVFSISDGDRVSVIAVAGASGTLEVAQMI